MPIKTKSGSLKANPLGAGDLYSPGPWKWGKTSDGKYYVDTNGGLPVICVMQYRGEHKANAVLISASPDLLEACKHALPWIGKMIANGAHLNSVAPNEN